MKPSGRDAADPLSGLSARIDAELEEVGARLVELRGQTRDPEALRAIDVELDRVREAAGVLRFLERFNADVPSARDPSGARRPMQLMIRRVGERPAGGVVFQVERLGDAQAEETIGPRPLILVGEPLGIPWGELVLVLELRHAEDKG